jgi:hypothetical protein
MARMESKGESRYALRRAARFSDGGRTFRSLGEGQIERVGEKAVNPMPRPLDFAYFPKHTPKFVGQPDNTPMKHEDAKRIIRFRNRDFKYPAPARQKVVKTITYNHYKMNYAGGPTDIENA